MPDCPWHAQKQDDLFVVGTEEGFLHKCSAAFNAEYVSAYAGHEGAVYAVMWNRRHERVFLSASADWTVKLWHDARPKARRPEVLRDKGNWGRVGKAGARHHLCGHDELSRDLFSCLQPGQEH